MPNDWTAVNDWKVVDDWEPVNKPTTSTEAVEGVSKATATPYVLNALRLSSPLSPLNVVSPASTEDSKLEAAARDIGGLGFDLLASELLPPVVGDVLGSVGRQYFSNPEGVEKGQLAGDVAVGFVPGGGVGKYVFPKATKQLQNKLLAQTGMGAGANVGAINAETLIDEGRLASTQENLLGIGIGGLSRGVPTALRNNKAAKLDADAQLKQMAAKQNRIEIQQKADRSAKLSEVAEVGSLEKATQAVEQATKGKPETSTKTFATLIAEAEDRAPAQKAENILTNDIDPAAKPIPSTAKLQQDGVSLNKDEVARFASIIGSSDFVPKTERQAMETWLMEARQGVHWDDTSKLVDEVIESPRMLSKEEHLALLNDYGKLREQRTDLLNRLGQESDPFEEKLLVAKLQDIDGGISKIMQANTLGGTEIARALKSYDFKMSSSDFDFDVIKARKEAAFERPLTKEETTELFDKTQRLENLNKELEERVSKLELDRDKLVKEEVEKLIKEHKKNKKTSTIARQQKRMEAEKTLKDMGYRLNDITSLPELTFKQANAIRKLAEVYIEEGAENLDDLVTKMQKDYTKLGTQDILNSLGKRIKAENKTKILAMEQKIADFSQAAKAQATINELLGKAEKLEQQGKPLKNNSKEVELLREQVKILQTLVPTLTDGRGKYSKLQKQLNSLSDQLEGGYRNLVDRPKQALDASPKIKQAKAQITHVKKLLKKQDEDFEFESTIAEVNKYLGNMPDYWHKQKVNTLAKQILKAKKQLKTEAPKTAGELRSASFSRTQKLIEDLAVTESQIASGYRLLKSGGDAQKLITETEALVKAQLSEALGVMRKTDQVARLEELLQRGERQQTTSKAEPSARLQGLELIARELKDRIKKQTPLTDSELKSRQEAELKRAYEKLDNVQRQYSEGWRNWKAKNPLAPPTLETTKVKESIKEVQALIRAEDNATRLKEQINTIREQGYVSEPFQQVLEESAELRSKRIEQQRLQRELKEEVWKAENERTARAIASAWGTLAKKRGTATPELKKSLDDIASEFKHLTWDDHKKFLVAVWNIPRATLATADLSAYLRQGGIFMNSYLYSPSRWGEAADMMKKTLKAAFSQDAYDKIMADLADHPRADDFYTYGLALTDVAQDLSKREELFMSTLPEKIPYFGAVVRGSNRNMVAVLNMLRAAEFDNFLTKHPDATPQAKKAMANYINAATGRGNLGQFEQAANSLAQAFFSPRYAVSRYQVLASLASTDAGVRKKAWADMGKLAATHTGLMLLAYYGGAEVGLDPGSPDFGKILINDKHISLVDAGMLQPVRLATYALHGDADGEYPKPIQDTFLHMWKYKLHPSIGLASSMVTGKNWRGEEKSRAELAARSLAPIAPLEIFDAVRENGVTADDLLVPTGLLGTTVQAY